MKSIAIYAVIFWLIGPYIQAARGQQSDPTHPPPLTMVEGPQKSTGSPSESDVAAANNPIAPMNALFFQNYFAPTVYGLPGSNNLLDVRGVVISGRQIVRATLPISSGEDSKGNQQSGLGDFNLFDAIRVTPEESKNVLAVGPMVTDPTATGRFLGQGKWQAGIATVGVHSLSEGSELIGIFTWQHSFAGLNTRPNTQTLTFQPIAVLSVGRGYYVRSSGIWGFDIHTNKELIPLGAGFGKVFKLGPALANAFIEPQFTVFHNGSGLPSFQLLSGLYILFQKKTN